MNVDAKPLTFEEAIQKLDEVLKNLNQGDISLENAVQQYKIGLDMANFCQKKLKETEGEIRILQNGLEEAFSMEE